MNKLLIALAAALLSTSAMADTLIYNANGIQASADGKLQRFSGIVIGDEGKVKNVLTSTDNVRLANITQSIDAQGRTLLPGLIDAHGHVMQLGLQSLEVDAIGSASLQDLQQRLVRYAAQHPGSGWIQGRGWNEETWPDKRLPTAADLDAVMPDRPVWLYRADGHAALANSLAMRLAGVTAATATPAGGEIVRDANGPTGIFVDNARHLIEAKIPPLTGSDAEAALLAAQQVLLADGITTVENMRTPADDWASMKRLAQSDRLQMRIIAYAYGPDAVRMAAQAKAAALGDHLSMVGIKLYTDGALGSRGAWLKQPYADAPESRGSTLQSEGDLQQTATAAAEQGVQVAIHAIGDAANAQAIGTFEELNRGYKGGRRWRLEHAQILDPADIPRISKAGIIASMQPLHQVTDRTMAEKRVGPARLGGAYAWRSILSAGAQLAFGSDFPFDSPNPFLGLSAATSRQDVNGQPPGGWIPAQRLSFGEALHAFTRGAAYAGFAEHKIGALEPGKWADFIIVDRDVSKANPQSLARTQVLETWVAGKKVWQRSVSAPGERG